MLIGYEIGNHNNNELVLKTFKDININDVDILQRDRVIQYTLYMFKNITKDIKISLELKNKQLKQLKNIQNFTIKLE